MRNVEGGDLTLSFLLISSLRVSLCPLPVCTGPFFPSRLEEHTLPLLQPVGAEGGGGLVQGDGFVSGIVSLFGFLPSRSWCLINAC